MKSQYYVFSGYLCCMLITQYVKLGFYAVLYITSQFSPDSVAAIKTEIIQAFPDAEITETAYLGPVFSIHVGRKGYGISWCYE